MKQILKILLAEPDNLDRGLLIEAIEKACSTGIIHCVGSGLEVISFFKEKGKKPDLIFLELDLPLKNGIECLKYLKENSSTKEIPVIIISTNHYLKNIDRSYKNGAHFYLVKPAELFDLEDMVTEVFENIKNNFRQPDKQKFVLRVAEQITR